MKAISELLGKKRFWLPAIGAALITLATTLMTQLDMPQDTIKWVIGGIAALFGVAGINNAAADLGKEAKKIEVELEDVEEEDIPEE